MSALKRISLFWCTDSKTRHVAYFSNISCVQTRRLNLMFVVFTVNFSFKETESGLDLLADEQISELQSLSAVSSISSGWRGSIVLLMHYPDVSPHHSHRSLRNVWCSTRRWSRSELLIALNASNSFPWSSFLLWCSCVWCNCCVCWFPWWVCWQKICVKFDLMEMKERRNHPFLFYKSCWVSHEAD